MAEVASAFSISSATAELEVWRNFNMDQRKLNLDKSCVEMREAKTASINGRKKLNDITKAFRAKPKEEQINMMTEILKCYQEEIDQLSRRSKNCETTFFTLFKALYELPDPAVCIEGLINTVMTGSTNSLEIERLRAELAQYEEEFQQLKNQDITIRRLEDKLAEFKEQNEDKIAEEVAKRVLEVEARADGRIAEIMEVQRTVEKRYTAALETLQQAQHSADRAQTQLYEVSSQAERRITALQSENAILAEGTQRLALRLAESEREAQQVQQALQSLQQQVLNGTAGTSGKHGAGRDEADSAQSVEEELKTLQVVVNSLREELGAQSDAARVEKQRLESLNREQNQALQKEREGLQRARQELAERPSKEEFVAMRRQLKMVQKIAFNVQDDEAESETHSGDPESTTAGAALAGGGGASAVGDYAQLEALLAGRMKTLESELAGLRRDLHESRRLEAASKETMAGLKKSLETSTHMIARLESELEARTAALEASVSAAAGVPYPKPGSSNMGSLTGSAESGGALDLAALLGVEGEGSTKVKKAAVPGAAALTGNQQINMQMINILQSQRDQYKDKLTRSETLLQKLQVDLESAQAAKERLEADNLALYSKIRYLQSYGASSAGGAPFKSPQALRISNRPVFYHPSTPERPGQARRSTGEEGRNNGDYDDGYAYMQGQDGDQGQGADGADIESRYHNLYEQRMNPFDQFSQREKQRKLQELTVADRIVLNTTMAIVSNQTGRNFMLLYLGAMHLLVFFILYYSAHHVHSGCDPSLDHLSPHDTAHIAAALSPVAHL